MKNHFSRLPTKILQGFVLGYKYLISPLLPQRCRYTPSCSLYMMESLERHGACQGGILGMKRFFRCHPWSLTPPHDPVPLLNKRKD